MNASTDSKDTIKFWTFLTVMLLAVAVAVTLIDLTIKAAILAESNRVKLAMDEWWEVQNGQKADGRTDERNRANGSIDGNLSGDVLATDNAGLEAGNASNGAAKQTRTGPRNRNIVRPSDGN
jgi:hypothetical protein